MSKSLFNEYDFSQIMKAHIQEMINEISKLKCEQILSLSVEDIGLKAESYALKKQFDDVPKLNREGLEKIAVEKSGKFFWKVPFSGNKLYFDWSPSRGILYQSAEEVTETFLMIRVESSGQSDFELAEQRTEKKLVDIENSLAQLEADANSNYPKETIKNLAINALNKRKSECSNLNKPGYKIV